MAVNTGPVFDNPWILAGMIFILPLALFDYLSPIRKRIRGKLPKPLMLKLLASRLFFYLFLAFLITAAAGPRWGIGQARAGEYRRAADVVIAVDVSRSMLVSDGITEGITRLKRGTMIVSEAVAALPGTRFAVAVSRNRGIVAIPLTWDDGAVLALLESIDGSSLTGRGTNLESLLEAGAGAFQPSNPSNKVILLVSDGEELTGSIRNALAYCGRNNITVTSILTGSEEGAPVPGGAVPGGAVPGSEDIISRRDAATMRMAAGQTGGIFIDANREDAADVLVSHLRSLAVETESPKSNETNKERWFVFLILAIVAYGASKLCLLNLGPSPRSLVPIFLLLLATGCSNASGKLLIIEANFISSQGRFTEAIDKYTKALEYKDAAPYARYGIGIINFSMGEEEAALDNFAKAGSMLDNLPPNLNRELRYRICYNTGVVLFSGGNFSGAADSFRAALKTDGRKTEAKRNLELSILSAARQNTFIGDYRENEGVTALFDYIRQKELDQWTNREWQPEDDSAEPDY
jgi:Ca-activated chloride channel family protein